MKPSILLDATGGTNWIGGLYYKKNILFSLLSNENICKNYNYVVVTEKENVNVFSEFKESVKIIGLSEKHYKVRLLKLLGICLINRVKYIYPTEGNIFKQFGMIPIRWAPDFQHNHYPEFFSDSELEARSARFVSYGEENCPLVLSSQDCMDDFHRFYSATKDNVYVVHFVSYIENIIKNITPEIECNVLKKFGLTNQKYVCVMNQFWQHKNHIVVLEAMKRFYTENPESEFKFVFTGKLEDYRSMEYIDKVKALFEETVIKDNSLLLGFIDRVEQIVIMKNAEFVIQPSLFEGWGTVVEDAKVLDKTILLSDIPVHVEQKNEKCILFNPNNPDDLCKVLEKEVKLDHMDDIQKGIENMHKCAYEYSVGFEKLLNELEK